MQSLLTILTSATQASIVKNFSGSDLTEQPFAIGKDFNVTEEPVSDLHISEGVVGTLNNGHH